jgi:hypothetical protein
MIEQNRGMLRRLWAPLGPGQERRVVPRFRASATAMLAWQEGPTERRVPARLVDISRSGSALLVEEAPAADQAVRVRLDAPGFRSWIEEETLGVGPGPDGMSRVRLKFREAGPAALLEAAVLGKRRKVQRHDPFAGVEALEARQLMAAVGPDPGPAVAAQVAPADVTAPSSAPTPSPTLLSAESDALLTGVLYNSPGRMVSGVAADGAVGLNATWEAGNAPLYYIEQQRYGADDVQAGLATHNQALVQQGWKILDWGFNKEAANGSFTGTGDAFHSTSMFQEAAARALLLEVQSGAPEADALMEEYVPRIEATASWLTTPSVAARGDALDAPYTHRLWLLADALGETATLDRIEGAEGDPTCAARAAAESSAAASYARRAMAAQTPDGVNLEKGGADVSYQTYGILLAERYATVCPDPVTAADVVASIVKGLKWEINSIQSNGSVPVAGSTRTGVELNWAGKLKDVDYSSMIQAFDLASTLTGDPKYADTAAAIAAAKGWTPK